MLRIFIFVFLVPSLCFGANYYVDPTYNGANGSPNGSYSRPWANMAGQVRAHSFKTGDRLYFRSGTVTPMNSPLYVNWHGTAQNRVIIGAYYGENNFANGDIRPDERPILDGQNFLVPGTDSTGMIHSVNRPGYITIQDLEIRDSGSVGIFVGNTSRDGTHYPNQHYIIRNNYINRSWASSMTIGRTSHNQILNNTTILSSYGNWRTHPHRGTYKRISGASIEVTGMHIYGVSEHNLVSGNTVSMSSYEGIGFYKRSRYGNISNNTVFDCSVNIYIGGSRDITISGNLVYATPEAIRGANSARNIILQHEYEDYGHFPIQSMTENVKIFNNFIAGGRRGIGVSVYEGSEWGWRNVEIYNNILVNNDANFNFNNTNVGSWQNNFIYGNYSFQYETAVGQHTMINSPNSFKWNRDKKNNIVQNYFTGNKMPSGNAGQGATFNNAHLAKMTGWREFSPGEVTIEYFSLEGGVGLEPEKVKNVMITESAVFN